MPRDERTPPMFDWRADRSTTGHPAWDLHAWISEDASGPAICGRIVDARIDLDNLAPTRLCTDCLAKCPSPGRVIEVGGELRRDGAFVAVGTVLRVSKDAMIVRVFDLDGPSYDRNISLRIDDLGKTWRWPLRAGVRKGELWEP